MGPAWQRGGKATRGRALARVRRGDGPGTRARCAGWRAGPAGSCWAEWGLGPRGEERGWRVGPAGLSRRGGGGPLASGLGEGTEVWAAGLGWGDGLSLVLGSFSNSSSLLFLIQTKIEFKYKFEFKPHSNKSMHQHECNTKFKPMIKF